MMKTQILTLIMDVVYRAPEAHSLHGYNIIIRYHNPISTFVPGFTNEWVALDVSFDRNKFSIPSA